LFNKATINLESGKSFTVDVVYKSKDHIYIKSVKLNGEKYEYSYISHQDIMNGGSLVFEMTDKPSNWGTKDEFIPSTKIDEHVIVASPFIAKGDIAFKGSTEVSLANVDKEVIIYYSLGDDFQEYKRPFTISKKQTLKVYAVKENIKSRVIVTDFYKIDPNLKIELQSEYANQYNAGGNNALIDGIVGTEDFRTGTWQGYHNKDLVAIVDLGSQKKINEVSIGFLQDQRSWIFYPTEVNFLVSNDGINFQAFPNGSQLFTNVIESEKVEIKNVKFDKINNSYRYIKIIAKKLGKLPEWHLGNKHDGRSWLFVDEIQIK
jgi:hypothetical protein